MSALTVQPAQKSGLPRILPKKLSDDLARCHNALEQAGTSLSIPASSAPSANLRADLQDRALDLAAWLEPASEKLARREVGALLDVKPRRSGDDMDTAAKLRIYAFDLADLPAFALVEACKTFRRSEGWMPQIGEIRTKALTLAQPVRDELAKIDRVLTATIAPPPVDDPARRQEAAAHVRSALDHMRSHSASEPSQSDPDRALAELRDRYSRSPCALGEAALKTLRGSATGYGPDR